MTLCVGERAIREGKKRRGEGHEERELGGRREGREERVGTGERGKHNTATCNCVGCAACFSTTRPENGCCVCVAAEVSEAVGSDVNDSLLSG